ncbi:MAG: 3'-5' exonuclease [Bacteroidetes bacterium]|nr:3'-5' exonuclease [Bacteroidota bacterium]MCW5897565.1 3'-5' exonuclease [Bacteroidota bacterium]
MNFQLSRPLVFFDLETTGTDFVADRIVQISVLKIHPELPEESRTRLINPGMPIPPEASAIHGITDGTVRDQPHFRAIVRGLFDFFSGCDLAGYNSNSFDVPFLVEEFARCGIEFPQEGTKLIDVCTIFKRKEERTLTAAYKFYCGKMLENAHDAEADVRATFEVFKGQLHRYEDLGSATVGELHNYCTREEIVDYARKLTKNEAGEIVFNFGKHKNQPIASQLEYAKWMVESDFPEGTKIILRRILTEQSS